MFLVLLEHLFQDSLHLFKSISILTIFKFHPPGLGASRSFVLLETIARANGGNIDSPNPIHRLSKMP
jgi:hypothetical protein